MSEEHLTDGWEPDLPVGDTLARRFLFNLAAFHEVPAVAAGGRVLRRDDVAAADLGRPAAMHNAATLLRPLPFDRPGEVLEAGEGVFDGGHRGRRPARLGAGGGRRLPLPRAPALPPGDAAGRGGPGRRAPAALGRLRGRPARLRRLAVRGGRGGPVLA